MKFLNFCLNHILLAGLIYLLPAAAHGAQHSADSGNTTVDTRGTGTLLVTGRVLNRTTGLALPGATASVGGVTGTTATNGTFSLANVNLAAGSTLTTGKTGFLSQTQMISPPAGAISLSVGDIQLSPLTNLPVVEWIQPDVDGIYLAGFGLQPPLKTRVNWNGTTPGTVTVAVNGSSFATLSGAGPEYTTAGLAVDSYLTPSFNPQANKVTVSARNSSGQTSHPLVLPLAVITVPSALERVVNSSLYQRFGPDELGFDFTLFPVKQEVTVPVLGKFGFEFGLNTSFDYTMSDGVWELALGARAEGQQGKRGQRPLIPGLTREPKLKFYLGNKEITGKVAGTLTGTATRSSGILLNEAGATVEIAGKFELTRYSPLDVIPGLTAVASKAPALEKVLRNAAMIIYAKPGFEGDLNCHLVPEFGFKDATVEGTLGLEAAYEPKIGKLEGRVYIGGEGRAKFGLPAPVLREAGLKFYAGYEVEAWVFSAKKEVPFGEYTYPSAGAVAGRVARGNGGTNGWKVMKRPWRDAGSEVLLQAPERAPEDVARAASPNLAAFNLMGRTRRPREIPSDATLPAQAVLPLLANVFPGSEPALAERNGQILLLYVRDTGVANPVQFTEIAFTRYDGTTWSTPAPLAANARAQFAPQVMFAGNGDAVAVWEQVNDPAFAGTDDPLAMGAHMEMLWSRRDAVTGTWTAPASLTANAVVDHSPRLAGPLADGDLFLSWMRNDGNRLAGEGTSGAVTNDKVMLARWDAVTNTWSTPSVLVDTLTGNLSQSFAAAGNKAACVWIRDMDGNLDDLSDTELYYRTWDGTAGATGTWGAVTLYTTDAVREGTVRVTVGADGAVYPLWQHGIDLVMSKNFSGAPQVVRTDSGTMGFADFTLTVGSGGNVLVLWQEMTAAGSDAHYRVYDPASATWSLDTQLSHDAALERSFAPVWDSAGNLAVAYNNVEITKQSKTVALEGGGSTVIEGVPQPGRVDLLVARRAIVKDLGFVPDSLTATGTTYLPGDAVTFKAIVRNTGNVAVENVVVSFFDGDPTSGGTLIQAVMVPGWLRAAEEREVSATWTVPAPATTAHTIFAVVDQAATVTERDETNNRLSLAMNITDLDLHYLNGSVLSDGSVRVVARIRNLGAPSSPVAELKLWPKENPGPAPLATVAVSQLAPGESVEIPLDLPAGAHAEGERAYRLTVNEGYTDMEGSADNNAVLFSLTLWIDADGDGMPAGWEASNGFSDSSAADAAMDTDADGFTNAQEFLSGTNPRNAQSRLKTEELAVRTVPGTGGHEFTVSWASVAGRSYVVERSYDMAQWTVVASGVQATPPLNSLTDTVTSTAGKIFYRIRVR